MANQLAIDFVSPLPPVRSGIADYSVDLLQNLEGLCDVRVIRLPRWPSSPAATRMGSARRAAASSKSALGRMGERPWSLAPWSPL